MYVSICLERVSLRGILSPGNLFLELAIVKPCWRNCSPLHLLDGINRTSGSHENEHNYYHFGGQWDLVKRWKQGSTNIQQWHTPKKWRGEDYSFFGTTKINLKYSLFSMFSYTLRHPVNLTCSFSSSSIWDIKINISAAQKKDKGQAILS